ncbi:MAG TPA: hypothetical protein VGM90_17870 [Kofleriaceae bacterium]|jgi:hypothetical protein
MRYAPRLIAPGTAPKDAFVEPLIANPTASPLGEHAQIPEVAWMVESDGVFVHVPAAEHEERDAMRGYALITMLDGELSNEALEDLPGISVATNGTYAAELLLDADHLEELHRIFGGKIYLAGAPRHGRLLVGGIGAGVDGMRAFVGRVRREHDTALVAERISPVTLLVRDGAPTAVVGEMQLAALAHATASRG